LKRPERNKGDAEIIATLPGVIESFRNPTNWYNNASFLLPLAAAGVSAAVAAARRSPEIAGFAVFLFVVALLMLPFVIAGWRQTATAVVLTNDGLMSLHNGRTLRQLRWHQVRSIGQRDTQGNVRWEISAEDGDRILLDGDLEDLPRLIELARRLAGLVAPDSPGP
jgi:hypothetical protein